MLNQFECAWALTNVVSGTSEHTKYVVDLGFVPVLLEKALSQNSNVAEQVHLDLSDSVVEMEYF